YHLPIRDAATPDSEFEARWVEADARLRALLYEGRNVLVHCMGGLGRSGMIAAARRAGRGAARGDPARAPGAARCDRDGGAGGLPCWRAGGWRGERVSLYLIMDIDGRARGHGA